MPIVWQRLLASRSADHRVLDAKIPEVLPILWLTDVVTYPGAVLPQLVTSAEDVALVDAAFEGDALVLAVSQPYSVGVVGRIVDARRTEAGFAILLQGIERREIVARLPGGRASTRRVVTKPLTGNADERTRQFRVLAMHWARASFDQAKETIAQAEVVEQLVDFTVAHLDVSTMQRQRILQMADLNERVSSATEALNGLLSEARNPPNAGTPECPVHGEVAVSSCQRCGSFACPTCLGPKPELGLCRTCRRPRPPAPPAAVALVGSTLISVGVGSGAGWVCGGDAFVGRWIFFGGVAWTAWVLADAMVFRRAALLNSRLGLFRVALLVPFCTVLGLRLFLVR